MLGIQAALGPRLRGDERTLVASFADCATALARPSPASVFRLAMVLPFMHLQPCGGPRGRRKRFRRSVAQWLEHRSPKPGVGGSSPSTPATTGKTSNDFNAVATSAIRRCHFFVLEMDSRRL